MASPLYQDKGSPASSAANANVVLPKPANLAVGDTMVAYFIVGTSLTVTVTTPATGWSPVTGSSGTAGRQAALTTDNETAFCYTKVATSGDVAATDFTWVLSASLPWHSPGILRVTGSNGTVNVSASLGNTGATNHAVTINPTVAETLALGFWGMGSGSALWTLDANMTSIYNASLQSLPVLAGSEARAATGSITRTSTSSSGQGSADFLLALEPGTGGGGASDPALNTNFTAVIGDEFALRTDIQETAGTAIASAFHLYAQKNISGGYSRVTTTSAGLRIAPTARFVDAAATTDMLAGGTGTFVAGEGDEDGVTGTISLGAGGNTEIEWSLTIDSTGVVAGDFWDVRVYRSDGSQLDSYSVTPRITAVASGASSPTIGLNPTALSFNVSEGGGSSNKNLSVSNTGGGTLAYSVSDDASWLSIAPTSGNAPATLVVTVNASTLLQANSPYVGTITIAATGATNTPQTVTVTVTVGAPSSFPVEIVSGAAGYESIWLETSNDIPPTVAPNGAMYIVNEHSDVALDQGRPGMRKSTDGGATWTHMDPQTTGKFDLESGTLLLVGTDLIFAWQRSGYYGYFNVFDTTTDTWTNRTEAWKAETSITATDQVCTLAERSDGTYVLVVTSSATQLSYLTRSTAPAWSSMTVLDAEAGKDFSQAYIKKSANGDAVHIFYYCLTDGIIYHRSLSSGGVLSARTSVATGLSTGSGTASFRKSMPNQAVLCWDNAGTDRLYVAYRKSDGKLYGRTLDGSGAAPTVNAEESISSGFVGINPDGIISYQAVGVVTRDSATGEIYVLWADGATATSNYPTPAVSTSNNMKMRVRSAAGVWGSESSPHVVEPIAAMAASIVTFSAQKYVMVFYDEYTGVDPGVSKFTRFAVAAGVSISGGVANDANSATVGATLNPTTILGGVPVDNDVATVGTAVNTTTIAGGSSTENDSATVGIAVNPVTVTGGVATEDDSGTVGTAVAAILVAGSPSTENDSATVGVSVNPATILGGVAPEDDSATAGTAAAATLVVGSPSTENDTATAGTVVNPATILGGAATEDDSATTGASSAATLVAGSPATENDSATVGVASNPATVAGGVSTEDDSATAGSTSAQILVSGGASTENDSATSGVVSNPATIAGGVATEDDSANVGTTGNQQVVTGGRATEDDSVPAPSISTWPVIGPLIFSEMGYAPAGALAQTTVVSGSPATENDSAVAGAVLGAQAVTGGSATEDDSATAGVAQGSSVIVFGSPATQSDVAPSGQVVQVQVIFGGVATESDSATIGGGQHPILARIDLPTFVTLDPQRTTVATRKVPETTIAIRRTQTATALEQQASASAVDTSVNTSARVESQPTTIALRRTDADMVVEQYEDDVQLDAEPTGALVDA